MCPFYRHHEKAARSIACEGYTDELDLVSRFQKLGGMYKHMGAYCCSRYNRCPIYKLTYQKYED